MSETVLRQWLMFRMIPRAPRKIDAATIQSRLSSEDGIEVTMRTIERDLVKFQSVFPIECDSVHKPYGWSWRKQAKAFEVPGMDPHTAVTFRLASEFLAHAMPRSTLSYLEPHVARARELLDTLSSSGLRSWPSKVRIVPWGPPLQPPPIEEEVLEVVYGAVFSEQRFLTDYRPRGATETKEYQVNPLGLVLSDRVIYLVCSIWEYPDIRTLALHRMSNPRLLETPVRVFPDFDLDAFIAQGELAFQLGPDPIGLQVRFEGPAALHLHESPLHPDQRLTEQPDGTVLLEATVNDTAQLRWWLRGFGEQVEVLAPPSLREELKETVKAMSAKYGL